MRCWLAVFGTVERCLDLQAQRWWCVPMKATKGDLLLAYCARSASPRVQGIFALCRVKESPQAQHSENYRCRPYGNLRFRGHALLRYVEMEILEEYEEHVTASDLKENPNTKDLPFVRRNFQGTTFEVDQRKFELLVDLLRRKNPSVKASNLKA